MREQPLFRLRIDNKYLPELIRKLKKIDENKNKRYIEEFETRYKNYQRVLFLNKLEPRLITFFPFISEGIFTVLFQK